MQNLGKADRTTDDIFEEHLSNFNQQQVNANRLHKDISSYIRCVKGRRPRPTATAPTRTTPGKGPTD